MAQKQSTGKIEVKADRGLIYDRKGRQLAINVLRNELCGYPSGKQEIKYAYGYLDRLYGRTNGKSRRLHPLKPERFRWIDRNLPDNLALRIANDSVPGLYIRKGMKRDYPFGGVGRQLLGCTDIDGKGISGLEFSYDSLLAGSPGFIDYIRDAHRNTYRIREIPLVKPLAGNSVVLTVDWYFQEIVEDELRAAVEEYNALEGTSVFVDCHSGEILAAADYVAGGKTDAIKLRTVSNTIEPGSVFKIITAATLLDEEAVDLEEEIYCEKGSWKCGRRLLRDDKKHDTLTFRETFELSSNIGIAKLAQRIGGEKLVKAARRFGFGQKTMVGLPGEQSGMIAEPGVWSDYNIAALSIGHAISVTPLQLVLAVAAVANGGKLYRPLLIKGMVNSEGKLVRKYTSEKLGKVMREDDAELLRSFMQGVVEKGTAMPARSEIVSIAGKTGTAEVPDLERGGYLKNKFVASFLGFFPVEDPRIAGIVVLHQPEPVHYGGHTAGPAFRNMAERYSIANSDLMRPDTRLIAGDHGLKMKEVPDFVGRDVSLAARIAEKKGMHLVADSSEGVVVWQYPPEGRRVPGSEKVAVLVDTESDQTVTMLNLVGMKLRTAAAVLDYQGLEFKVVGCGVVKKQSPSAGAMLNRNAACRLVCGSA
ncbi:MAG: PASTA domain-containing protein [Candidatus Zixiibacteriota bacterium]|nr:MAG: PASTA domain-containing protein [candidate division Zixibacteria bacterium]